MSSPTDSPTPTHSHTVRITYKDGSQAGVTVGCEPETDPHLDDWYTPDQLSPIIKDCKERQEEKRAAALRILTSSTLSHIQKVASLPGSAGGPPLRPNR
jgi:hypothetical protein